MIYLLIYIFFKNHMHINLGTFCLRRLVLKYLSSERISICFSQVPEATTNLELLQLNSQTGGFSDHTSGFRCKPLCGTDCGYKFSGFFFFSPYPALRLKADNSFFSIPSLGLGVIPLTEPVQNSSYMPHIFC